ncbi:uncharacterized protein LOC131671343 [Phymastichus coffea]|uniref:uncharacterized protein LOC131671343 n=1 Tax=Phymastichus coffea TaxID=108790 RepID=UPI00273BBE96|nr:uncharacterized protein LOC131671343 [Phymastichus coffea]
MLNDEDTYELGRLLNDMKIFGCDVDDQDASGKTPLHFATFFRYHTAVKKLFSAGADINIIDKSGRTAFSYLFEMCSWHQECPSAINYEVRSRFTHNDIFKLFVNHIKKLKLLNIEVNESNEDLFSEALEIFDNVTDNQETFLSTTKELWNLKIKFLSLTIGSFLSDTGAIVDYPTMPHFKQKDVDEFFHKIEEHSLTINTELYGILQLQYRKALKRKQIFDLSLKSLPVLLKFQISYDCWCIILQFLSNSDLENLIAAVFDDSDTTILVG